jgi:hypothetical protein
MTARCPNPVRGETELVMRGTAYVLRPSFEALVAAEQELGSLFMLLERAAEGRLTLAEIAALLWHCLPVDERPARACVGEAVLDMGLVTATRPVRAILAQVLQGRV